MKNDYGSFVMNYRRWTNVARSYDEAFKTADYATPIWRCETENEAWLKNNSWWLIMIAVFIAMVFVIYPTMEWIITR